MPSHISFGGALAAGHGPSCRQIFRRGIGVDEIDDAPPGGPAGSSFQRTGATGCDARASRPHAGHLGEDSDRRHAEARASRNARNGNRRVHPLSAEYMHIGDTTARLSSRHHRAGRKRLEHRRQGFFSTSTSKPRDAGTCLANALSTSLTKSGGPQRQIVVGDRLGPRHGTPKGELHGIENPRSDRTCSNQTSETSAACWVFLDFLSRRPLLILLQRGLDRRRAVHGVCQCNRVLPIASLVPEPIEKCAGRLGIAKQHHVVLDPAPGCVSLENSRPQSSGWSGVGGLRGTSQRFSAIRSAGLLLAQGRSTQPRLKVLQIGLENPGSSGPPHIDRHAR